MSDPIIPPKDHAEGDFEKVYREYWQEIIEPGGVFSMEQVKRELFDFHLVMGIFAEVYCEITGNRLSKLTYYPRTYVNAFEEEVQKAVAEAIEEEREDPQHSLGV